MHLSVSQKGPEGSQLLQSHPGLLFSPVIPSLFNSYFTTLTLDVSWEHHGVPSEVRRQLESQLFPSTTWISGMELRSPNLRASI